MDETDASEDVLRNYWIFCGKYVPKQQIIFFSRMILIYVVVIVSILNIILSVEHQNVWVSTLSYCVGVITEAPGYNSKTIQKKKRSRIDVVDAS